MSSTLDVDGLGGELGALSLVLGWPSGGGDLGTWAAEGGNIGEGRSYLKNVPGFKRTICNTRWRSPVLLSLSRLCCYIQSPGLVGHGGDTDLKEVALGDTEPFPVSSALCHSRPFQQPLQLLLPCFPQPGTHSH